MADTTPAGPRVGLFVTCLVDLYRPSVGFSALELLERAGCRVEVPDAQTCCGQPAWNSGNRVQTQKLARSVIAAFEEFDYVVVPSGSCAGMIRDYAAVFEAESEAAWRHRAEALAARTYELTSFLVDVLDWQDIAARVDGVAAYHDSCSGLRQLGVRAQPRALLSHVDGLTVRDLAEPDECCGFGGTFCVKYSDISGRMVSDKATNIIATGATMLLAGDVGCLLNMAGRLKREGSPIVCRHVAEVLAGRIDSPGIGEGV